MASKASAALATPTITPSGNQCTTWCCSCGWIRG
jgi:hypothetical protein